MDQCLGTPIAGSPIQLCGKHIREVYQFAQDVIAEGWDSSVRDYVHELHDVFKPPRKVTKQPRQGYVYFIRFGTMLKVGFSEHPVKRLKALPHEQILGVIKGTREDERGWHQMLADLRVTGEWFAAEPEVLEAIAAVCAAQA